MEKRDPINDLLTQKGSEATSADIHEAILASKQAPAIAVYPLIPDEAEATIWFHDGRDVEIWQVVVDKAGCLKSLTDTDGKRYESMDALKAVGVKRLTLACYHVLWVE